MSHEHIGGFSGGKDEKDPWVDHRWEPQEKVKDPWRDPRIPEDHDDSYSECFGKPGEGKYVSTLEDISYAQWRAEHEDTAHIRPTQRPHAITEISKTSPGVNDNETPPPGIAHAA